MFTLIISIVLNSVIKVESKFSSGYFTIEINASSVIDIRNHLAYEWNLTVCSFARNLLMHFTLLHLVFHVDGFYCWMQALLSSPPSSPHTPSLSQRFSKKILGIWWGLKKNKNKNKKTLLHHLTPAIGVKVETGAAFSSQIIGYA